MPDAKRIATSGTRAAAVHGSLRLVAQAIEFGTWVAITQLGTLAETGAVALAVLGARYAGFLADWGAQYTGSREVARHVARPNSEADPVGDLITTRRWTTTIALALFATGLCVLDAREFLPLLALVALRGLNRDWASLGHGRAFRSSAPAVVQMSTTAAILLATREIALVPAAYGIGGLVALALSLLWNPASGLRIGSRRWRPRRIVGGWWAITGLAALVYATIDTLLLGLLVDNDAVAVYASVARFPNAVLLLVGLAVSGIVPSVTRVLVTQARSVTTLSRQAAMIGGLAGGATLLSIPLLWLVVPAIFGPAYVEGRPAMVILMIASAVVAFGAPFQSMVIAAGDDRQNAAVTVISAFANVLGNLVAIPRFGLEGAAATTLATQSIPTFYFVWMCLSERLVTSDPAHALQQMRSEETPHRAAATESPG